MKDLIVFSVATSFYAIDIENIQRIIQNFELTNIPNAHKFIDGMMPYEEGVIKVLNFRKLIGMQPHEDDLKDIEDSTLKLLLYENDTKIFAIKVDAIKDIAHVEDDQLVHLNDEENNSEFLDLEGVLDLDGILINVIKSLKLPNS